MFATLISATLITAFTIQGALAEFVINTNSLTQCEPVHITWTQATGPYNLAVVPVDDPCNTILVDLGDHDKLSMTWNNVTLPAGTKAMFSLLDSSDQEAWSGAMTVADGDASCLPSVSSAVSSAAAVSSFDVSSFSGSATTLYLTSSLPETSAASESETATIVGAANAGTLGNASGAMSNTRLPAAATVFASLAAVAAALAL